jgi:hypothetical protein
MTYLRGYMEPGKEHSQVHLNAPGLCPVCLERYVHGADGGGKTDLVEEVIDGVKTGKWVCPYGGRSWYQQGARPFIPPILPIL